MYVCLLLDNFRLISSHFQLFQLSVVFEKFGGGCTNFIDTRISDKSLVLIWGWVPDFLEIWILHKYCYLGVVGVNIPENCDMTSSHHAASIPGR